MARSAHPKKEIAAALRQAESQGWRVEIGGSPCLRKMYCSWNDAEWRCGEFCIACIWSSPKNATNHAPGKTCTSG